MSDELVLLAGNPEGLFAIRSRDEGKSWEAPERLLTSEEVATIRQAPDGTVYAGTRGDGIFRSRDTRRWEPIEVPPGLEHARSFCISEDRFLVGNEAAAEPVGIFEWEEGKTWRRLGDLAMCSGSKEWHYPVATEGVHIRHLARDSHKPERIYAAIQVGGIGISPDGGQSWYDRLNLDCDVHMVEPHPTRAGVLYAGTGGGGLYRSDDYGDAWGCISEGCGKFVVQFALDPDSPERMYLGTARGGVRQWREDPAGARGEMFRSDDGGSTWQKLGGGLPELMRSRVNTVLVDPQEPRNVFFSGGHTRGEADSGVHQSRDGGETWRSIAPVNEVVALCCVWV